MSSEIVVQSVSLQWYYYNGIITMGLITVVLLQWDSFQNCWFPELLHFGILNFYFSNYGAKQPRNF